MAEVDPYVNDPASGWRSPLLMLSDTDCQSCGEPVGIFARVDGVVTCAVCWKKQGQPFHRHLIKGAK